MKSILISTFFFLLSPLISAHEHPHPTMPKEFDALKRLEGTWTGTGKMDGKEEPISVVYKVTSGGTALTENLFPGTPNEMVSIYHKDGNSLAMTHYCALGNHPEMKLKKADAKSIAFEMVGTNGIQSLKELHMHAIKLTFNDADTLTQEWTNYEKGKPGETATFSFKRQK